MLDYSIECFHARWTKAAHESYVSLANALAAADPPNLLANFFSEAPEGTTLEQSCRLSTSFPMTAKRFHASVNAVFHPLTSPAAKSAHFS